DQVRFCDKPQDREDARPRSTACPPCPRRRGHRMIRRREFITLLGGAAAWPLAAHGQARRMPVVGYLISRGPDDAAHLATAFRRGLRDANFIEGQNVKIEYRWGRDQFESLKTMAEELCRMPVAVLAATGGVPAVLAAKAATSTIPIVFGM